MNLLFGFSGRIGRSQWWLAQLAIALILGLGAGVVYVIAINGAPLPNPDPRKLTGELGSVLLVVLATIVLALWVNLASTVKRFHDRDKSGFWCLIFLIPYIGAIWQIVECGCLPGSRGSNNYGPPNGPGLDTVLGDLEKALYAEHRRAEKPQTVPLTPAPQAGMAQPRRAVTPGFGRRGLS